MKTCIFFCLFFLFFGKIWAQNAPNFEVEHEDSSFFILHSSLDECNSPLQEHDSTIYTQHLSTKDPILAWLISFPAGILGLHRVYLGTDVKTVLLYIATAGGFLGIVPMIDWILLLRGIQTGDISRFVNNRRFIMWLEK